MWKYNYSDDRNDWLAHAAGFKYLSKKLVNGKWVYVYPEDVARGSNTNGDPRLQRSQTGRINVNKNAARDTVQGARDAAQAGSDKIIRAFFDTKSNTREAQTTKKHLEQRAAERAKRKVERDANAGFATKKSSKNVNNVNNKEKENKSKTAYYKETGERLDQAKARAKKYGNDAAANEKAMLKNINKNKKQTEKNKVSAANTANAVANAKMASETKKAVAQEKRDKKGAKSAVKTSTAKTNARFEQVMKRLTEAENKRKASAKTTAANTNAKSNAKAQKELEEEKRRRLNAYKKYNRY